MKIPRGISVASLCLAVITVHAFAADTTAAPKSDDIVAALPVIPEAKFNLADFGGVGDGKTFNTEAFKSAIAAIAKAGGGHLIVVAGTDNGLRIKSYRGAGGEVHDIWYSDITMKNVRRPFDINMLYHGNDPTPWGDVGPREALPGETNAIPNFHDIPISNLTVTRSPVAGRILGLPEQMARDITFTNVKIDSVRGFLVQDGKNVVFDHVQITSKTGEAIVLDNGSVTWNGEAKSGNIGGSPIPFYTGY